MQLYKVEASDGHDYMFECDTPLQAMHKMCYYLKGLSIKKIDDIINKTESGEHLWFDYNGITYAIKNDILH